MQQFAEFVLFLRDLGNESANIVSGTEHNFGGNIVLTTIFLGTCVAVQGTFVERLANGSVTVRVGKSLFTGRPASAAYA